MKESVERIRNTGKASLLNELVDKMGPVIPVINVNKVVIECDDDYVLLDKNVEVIEVGNGVCCNSHFTQLGLSEFVKLRELVVGDECFHYVNDLRLIGLNMLIRVEIGKHCFYQTNEGEFVLKDCEKLETVKIGDGSFVGVVNVVFESESCPV